MDVEILTAKDLQKWLKITEVTMAKHIREGMPCFKLGRHYRFDKAEVLTWIKRDTTKPINEPAPPVITPPPPVEKPILDPKALRKLKTLAHDTNGNPEKIAHARQKIRNECLVKIQQGKCCPDKKTTEKDCPLKAYEGFLTR